MFCYDKYISFLQTLHWGQLIRLKWYCEEKLNLSLFFAPYCSNEIVEESYMMMDIQTIFTLHFEEGAQNITNKNLPLIEIYCKRNNRYTALRRVLQEINFEIPSIKDLRKIKPSASAKLVEV